MDKATAMVFLFQWVFLLFARIKDTMEVLRVAASGRGAYNEYLHNIYMFSWRNKKHHHETTPTKVVQKILSLTGFLCFIPGIF